ncbi:MAG: Bro-N domain-containing protein [Ignavibacteriales bacterium]|nr:Bro-N domain-containing protein [Ignavibacteriales bacterium]
MNKETAIKIFEQKKIRSHWDDEQEKWYFSVVDVVGVLTESPNPRKYWSVLKTRLKKEGSELATNCSQLKMLSSDGKNYNTDVADTEQLFRLIQSVPSPKAEPFKLWLAKVARERIDEIEDPEIGIDRLMETYLKKGYSKEWINQRLKSIEVRKDLTDEWEKRGVSKGQEYAILTDEITKAWSSFSVMQYKKHKGLKKENLRDNMSNLELVLNMLAEATTTEISKEKKPKTFTENKIIANQGGTIAGNTRKEIEEKTGKRVVTRLNAKNYLNDKKKLK